MESYSKEFVAASTVPLVLSILAKGESYGYALIKAISEASAGQLEWSEGMLYPLLAKLEQRGIVQTTWGKSETGRARKYYQLSPEGHAFLAKERQNWEFVTAIMHQIWNPQTSLT